MVHKISGILIIFLGVWLLIACDFASESAELKREESKESVNLLEQEHNHDHDHDHDHDHSHHREAGVHTHGAGVMTLVLEDNLLNVGLNLPAVDLVGFERAANTEQEQDRLGQVVSDLRSANKIIAIDVDAGCAITDVIVESALLQPDQRSTIGHADVDVYYEFTCRHPEKISALNMLLFKQYPALKDLDVTWIIHDQQGAQRLSADSAIFTLKRR